MKLFSTLAVACLTVCAATAAETKPADPKVKEALVGKWDAVDGELKGSTFEFTKDGAVKLSLKLGEAAITLDGKYKVADAENLEMSIKGPDGKEKTDKIKYKLDTAKNELTLTGPDGKAIKFTKAK